MVKNWRYCITHVPLEQHLLPELLQDEVFGLDNPSKWHQQRGLKPRVLRHVTDFYWITYYGILEGMATDDEELAARFIAICERVEANF